MHEQRRRGQLDALQGKPLSYGCHTGMRSTRERNYQEYIDGYNEVYHYLLNGDTDTDTKQREIARAYKDGQRHAMDDGERYKHPYAWDVPPSYHREVTKAWLNGYDSVKPKLPK